GSAVPLPSFTDGLRAAQAVRAALQSRATRAAVAIPPPPTTAGCQTAVDDSAALADPGRPAFSVVVPTFDPGGQLRRLLDALSLQRFPAADFEVIVVDDGGSAPLEPIVAPLRDRLQIRLLRQPTNRGCAAARQVGIEAARGKFLALTD